MSHVLCPSICFLAANEGAILSNFMNCLPPNREPVLQLPKPKPKVPLLAMFAGVTPMVPSHELMATVHPPKVTGVA